MSDQVTIIPIQKFHEDDRGSSHCFSTDKSGEFIIAYRKKGSLNARHYHKGRSANKNPEKIIIMQGAATINWIDTRTGATQNPPQPQPGLGKLFYRVTVEAIGPRNTRALAQYFYGIKDQVN